ncbi:hypothetical protein [Hoeflea sp.]|uniref:hypothetical protein n=1 Tax=Hoeflea sp. TaxID=1940281 RepID=UPI0037491182
MTYALAILAFTIAALFSGLVLGAMREAIAVRARPSDLTRGREAAPFARRSSF